MCRGSLDDQPCDGEQAGPSSGSTDRAHHLFTTYSRKRGAFLESATARGEVADVSALAELRSPLEAAKRFLHAAVDRCCAGLPMATAGGPESALVCNRRSLPSGGLGLGSL